MKKDISPIPTSQLFGSTPINRVVPNSAFPPISPRLQSMLQQIVADVVQQLECVGAIVATLERGHALPVRAYSIRFAQVLFDQLEKQAGLSLMGPDAVVYLDDERYKENLSCRAQTGNGGLPVRFVTSDRLHDLFRPLVSQTFSDMAQRLVGISQVIAMPFFIGDEVVGNVIAAKREPFSEQDINFLTAYGQQAALAIQSQRHLDDTQALGRVVLELHSNITDEQQIMQISVNAVVAKLDFVGGLIGVLGKDDALTITASAFNATEESFAELETKIGMNLRGSIVLWRPNDPAYPAERDITKLEPASGNPAKFKELGSLVDLYRPVFEKGVCDFVQTAFHIRRILVLPFTLHDQRMGALFVMTRKGQFSYHDRATLAALAQQVAAGIQNARLYRDAQEQRRIAQVFARMAFNASAYVHTLRNYVGAFRHYLTLSKKFAQLSPVQQARVLELNQRVGDMVDKSAEILSSLHEPWRQMPDTPTQVNACLRTAIVKLLPHVHLTGSGQNYVDEDGMQIQVDLASDIPDIRVAPEMLTEAYRIIIKNALEAVQETGGTGQLWVVSRFNPSTEQITVIVRDTGTGIRAEDLGKIFEMGWSTKSSGLGFGLFWVKDFVEGLGGELTVTSTLGAGATFHIHLPLTASTAN